MPSPIQIWSPYFVMGPLNAPFAQDILFAQSQWHGEDCMWLIPGATEVKRWSRDIGGIRIFEAMIPARHFNQVEIYHIDEGGKLFPPLHMNGQIHQTLQQGLYHQWVNALPDFAEGEKTITLTIPTIEDGRIIFIEQCFQLEPGPIIPIHSTLDDPMSIKLGWPPKEGGMTYLSPEISSREYYGDLHYDKDNELGDVVKTENQLDMTAINVRLIWPKPFDGMFITGGTMDLLYHQAMMRDCISKLERGDRINAQKVAELWMNQLTGDSKSPLEKAWFLPKVFFDKDSVLFDVYGQYSIDSANINELIQMEQWRQLSRSWIPVKRVNTWIGYFWWELYQDILSHTAIKFCRNCGKVIRGGHGDRMFCSREENPSCFRQRNARSQKMSRKKR